MYIIYFIKFIKASLFYNFYKIILGTIYCVFTLKTAHFALGLRSHYIKMSFFCEGSESLSAKVQVSVFLAGPRSILLEQIIDCIQSKSF